MAPSSADGARPPRFRDLAVRAVSAAVLAPIALAAVWFGFPWFDLLVASASVLMMMEWQRMAGGLRRPFWLAAGCVYIAAAVLAALWIRHDAKLGLLTFLWILAAVWATDIFAFFAGRTFGGRKLAPIVSPGKTWSGLAGGVAAAALISTGFAIWVSADWLWLALWGVLLALVAQAGDLAESAMKRRFGIKDSGRLIPGHGGILDRVDALLAVLIFLAIVRLLGDGATPWS